MHEKDLRNNLNIYPLFHILGTRFPFHKKQGFPNYFTFNKGFEVQHCFCTRLIWIRPEGFWNVKTNIWIAVIKVQSIQPKQQTKMCYDRQRLNSLGDVRNVLPLCGEEACLTGPAAVRRQFSATAPGYPIRRVVISSTPLSRSYEQNVYVYILYWR